MNKDIGRHCQREGDMLVMQGDKGKAAVVMDKSIYLDKFRSMHAW